VIQVLLLLIGVAALGAPSADARADVYRYRDPQTGRIKLTNVPPPWLKSPGQASRGPSVEVIREPPSSVRAPPAAAGTAPDAARAKPEPGARAPSEDARP